MIKSFRNTAMRNLPLKGCLAILTNIQFSEMSQIRLTPLCLFHFISLKFDAPWKEILWKNYNLQKTIFWRTCNKKSFTTWCVISIKQWDTLVWQCDCNKNETLSLIWFNLSIFKKWNRNTNLFQYSREISYHSYVRFPITNFVYKSLVGI